MEDVSTAEVKPCSKDGSGKRRRLVTYFALDIDAFGREIPCELVRLGETNECEEGVKASVAVAVAKTKATVDACTFIILMVFSKSRYTQCSISYSRL